MPYFSKLQEKAKERGENKLVRLFHLIRCCFKTQFLAFSFNYNFLEILLLFQILLLFSFLSLSLSLFCACSLRLVWACYKASEESFEVFGPWRDSQRCCTVHIEFEKFSSPGKKKSLVAAFLCKLYCLDCLKGNISRNIADLAGL